MSAAEEGDEIILSGPTTEQPERTVLSSSGSGNCISISSRHLYCSLHNDDVRMLCYAIQVLSCNELLEVRVRLCKKLASSFYIIQLLFMLLEQTETRNSLMPPLHNGC